MNQHRQRKDARWFIQLIYLKSKRKVLDPSKKIELEISKRIGIGAPISDFIELENSKLTIDYFK